MKKALSTSNFRSRLITAEVQKALEANLSLPEKQRKPIVKFFTPDAACTWLISEMTEDDLLFGLCDLGLGFPELGYVSLSELERLRGALGLPVERDLSFEPKHTLAKYAEMADQARHIIS